MNISTVDLTPVEHLLQEIKRTYVDHGLKYGWVSTHKVDYDYGHWNNQILLEDRTIGYDHNELQYLREHPAVAELWEQIQEIIGPRVLVRAYCNGYTYGTDAYYHQDDAWIKEQYGEDSVSETILIYLNDEWNRDWGGETMFIDEDDNIIASVLPKKNRCAIFDSNIWHRAAPLSRSCPHLRSIVVFKTAGPEYNRPHVQWIKDRTENIPHSGVTMFEHLYNTAMTIASMRGVPSHIINAGLYHSVYGTAYFDAELEATREEVIEQIGEKAEDLVYEFCNLQDRYDSILNNVGNWNKEKHFGLCLMELANTLEMSPRQQPNEQRNQRIAALDAKLATFDLKYD